MRQTLFNWLFALFIFLIPSNLFLQIFPETAYARGLQIDYLIPKIALSELVVLILIGFLGWSERRKLVADLRKTIKEHLETKRLQTGLWVGLIVVFVARQLVSKYPLASLDALLDLFGLVVLGFLAYYQATRGYFQAFISSKWFGRALGGTLLFQSLLALYQFWAQQSLLGYALLGEGNLLSLSNVSRITWFGRELVAPMGTTAHPNVLGGVLAIYLVSLWWKGWKSWGKSRESRTRLTQAVFGAVSTISIIALVLTGSISAWLTCIMELIVWKIDKKGILKTWPQTRNLMIGVGLCSLISLLFVQSISTQLPQNTSFSRRAYLNQAGFRIWKDSPWFGVGLQTSAAHVEEYSEVREVARFTQPPHHAGLVWLAETGILGILLAGGGTWLVTRWLGLSKFVKLAAISFFIISFDHYVLTISSGRELMLLLILGL